MGRQVGRLLLYRILIMVIRNYGKSYGSGPSIIKTVLYDITFISHNNLAK